VPILRELRPPGAWTPRRNFAVSKSLTQSLTVSSGAFEKEGERRATLAPTPRDRVGLGNRNGQGSRLDKISDRNIMARWLRRCSRPGRVTMIPEFGDFQWVSPLERSVNRRRGTR